MIILSQLEDQRAEGIDEFNHGIQRPIPALVELFAGFGDLERLADRDARSPFFIQALPAQRETERLFDLAFALQQIIKGFLVGFACPGIDV